MKIALTGHTAGLGKYIFDNISCSGFSRSNGYDITLCFDTLVNEVKNYDVLINNANVDNFQYLLCKNIWEIWKDDSTKKIINIGSRAKSFIKSDYGLNKKMLSNFTTYANFNGNCKVTCIDPGYINDEDLSYAEVFEIIKLAIEKNYTIENIVFFRKGKI